MSFKTPYAYIVFSVILLIAGCRVPKSVEQTAWKPTQEMPKNFASIAQADSLNPLPAWRNFFASNQLNQLIDSALRFNLDLKAGKQDVVINEAMNRLARVNNRPTLDAVFNAQADRFGFYTMNGIGNYDLNKSNNITPDQRLPEVLPDILIGLRSQWEIDVWGKLKQQRKSAAYRLLAARDGLQWLQTQLAAEVAYLYFEYLGLVYELEVVQRNVDLQQQALRIVQAQKEGGRATELAVRQFAAQVARTQAFGFDIQHQQRQTLNRLSVLLGRYPIELTCEKELMQYPVPREVTVGTPSQLLLNRPDVRAAQWNWMASTADLGAARAQFYPQVMITPTLGIQGFKPGKLFTGQSVAAGLIGNLTAPISQRRRVRESYQMAMAQREQAAAQAENAWIKAINEVHQLVQGHALMNSQIDARQREYTELRAAVSSARDLYTNGYANYLEVISAQQGLLDAEIAITLIRKNQLQNLVNLYRSLGGGWN